MRASSKFPARVAIPVGIPRPCHFDAIRLSRPKEWFRRDRNHAPGISDSD